MEMLVATVGVSLCFVAWFSTLEDLRNMQVPARARKRAKPKTKRKVKSKAKPRARSR